MKLAKKLFKNVCSLLLNEEFPIYQKLMNIVLATALVGAVISFFVSIPINVGWEGSFATLAVLLLVGAALYFSIVKRKLEFSACLVVCVIVALLPMMYFTSGGMKSGMPLWFVLGLVVPWTIFYSKKVIYGVFALAAIVFAACIGIERNFPNIIQSLPEDSMASDIVLSMVLVSIVFGALFRFQSYVYERQAKDLKDRDESLRKTMQELEDAMKHLEKANEAKSLFLANMSHEIRTPINAVLGMDEMILRETNDAAVEKYATDIRNSGQSLLAIINDILDFSKIESGKMEILPTVYEISSLMNDCYNMVAMRMKEKDLQFVVMNNPKLPKSLYGDEYRIRQVVVNLLTNALKYTKVGSVRFSIDFEKTEEKTINLCISVKDTGIGIAEKNLDKLFVSFARVDEDKHRNIEGTGLGLPITKQLVDLMFGSIEVKSELGCGSEFIIRIPQVVVSDEPVGDFNSRLLNRSVNNKKYHEQFQAPEAKILVVDDVQINMEVISGLLKQTKVQLDFATSGEQALGYILAKRYDLVLLDHMMPGMDGMETLEQLRTLQHGKDVPVIALTANALVGAAETYLSAGFSGYLSKPVRGDILESTLLKFLPKEKVVLNKESSDASVKIAEEPVIESGFAQTPVAEKPVVKTADMPVFETPVTKESVVGKSFLESLTFVDAQTGLLYCADDEALYRDIIRNYVENSKVKQIEEFFRAKDWENYRIHVHSLKSSSKTIGAMEVFELARLQEQSVINNDFAKAEMFHSSLMSEYVHLVDKLKLVLENTQSV